MKKSKIKILYLLALCILLYNCKSNKIHQNKVKNFIKFSNTKGLTKNISLDEQLHWQHLDIEIDSIAGISLNRAYQELQLDDKRNDTVIVAVLDMRIQLNHEDIKDFIWVNNDEIPDNGLDDDHNGYIDDINGWNFLGNSNREQSYRSNFEYVRIIKKFDAVFKNKTKSDISEQEISDFDIYKKAKDVYFDEFLYVTKRLRSLKYLKTKKVLLEKEIYNIYPDLDNSISSLYKIKTEDEELSEKIKTLIKLKRDSVNNSNNIIQEERYLNIYLNPNYQDREIIGDDVNNIRDKNYGNHLVASDTTEDAHTHAIKVAGVIAANRNNDIGIKGITNNVKIIPIAVSPYGDEQDKDIALGIRYAVDNGAKIINISSSKDFSLHKQWVMDALKYAELKDVLVITSAGNNARDLDKQMNYPNDLDENYQEVLINFIKVGASSHYLNENIIHYTSNYGKNNVDIFAPGRKIYTTEQYNNYGFNSGTSYSAPIVSGVAALIRSYYPNLTAADVKQIIMESGVSYDIMVNKPSRSKEKELVPFSSLSKSGKIVNAYNALLLAEKVSKKKKRKK